MSNVSINVPPEGGSKYYDDDGRFRRTGTVWTASAHIITAVIGSGVLSLAWATAQLGWIAGPTVLLLFAFVTYYTSALLSTCYRTGDPDTGKRNYTYMDVVRSNLGGFQVIVCGVIQYMNLFGTSIGYTIAASISMMAIQKSTCIHKNGHGSRCDTSTNGYMIAFGAIQILLSQIPDFNEISWLSILAAVMSFSYSFIGLGFSVGSVAESGEIKGSLGGISVGAVVGSTTVTETSKMWRCFQALGAIAFSYNFSTILVEIQDTIKSPPSEYKTMQKATLLSIAVTTLFYMLSGCFGYAAFGDSSPANLLTGFSFSNPYWLLDIANAAIVVHIIGAYQVYCQPLFGFVEKTALDRFPGSKFITKEFTLFTLKITLFRLVWRSMFVILTTFISMLVPFFNDVVGLLGAFGFWPLAVYFPVEMYIAQQRIPKWSGRWISLQILSGVCFVVSVCAAAGSLAGVVSDLNSYKPFHASY